MIGIATRGLIRVLLLTGFACAAFGNIGAAATISTVAVLDQPLPGATDGTVMRGFTNAVVNDAGVVAYNTSLFSSSGTSLGSAIVTSDGRVIRAGQQAPGAPTGVNISSVGAVSINASGELVFAAGLEGSGVDSGNNQGIFTTSTMVARKGAPSPGLPSGTTFVNFPSQPVISDDGAVAFEAVASGIAFGRNDVIYVGDTPEFFTTGPAPGLPAGNTIAAVSPPTINSSNEVAFVARLSGPDVTSDDRFALVANGSIEARTGQQIPNAPVGETFEGFASNPSINDQGDVANVVFVNDVNTLGLYSAGRLVATTGDPITDFETGLATGAFLGSQFTGQAGINNDGAAIFSGFLTDSDNDSSNNLGIFLAEQTGGLKLLLRSGEEVLVDGIAQNLGVILLNNFEPTTFTNFGDFVFIAQLVGGAAEAILMYEADRSNSPPAGVVPLPAAGWLMLAAIGGLLAFRRQRPH